MSDESLSFVIAAGVPALVALAFSLHAALALMIKADLFLNVVEKYLRSGHRDRAKKLCRAFSAPVTNLTRYALELQLPRFEEVSRGDYRAAPVDDLSARVAAALEAEARTQLRRLRPSLLAGIPALFIPLLALSPDAMAVRVWVAVASVVGVGCGLLSVLRYLRVRSQLLEVQRRLTPWVMSG